MRGPSKPGGPRTHASLALAGIPETRGDAERYFAASPLEAALLVLRTSRPALTSFLRRPS